MRKRVYKLISILLIVSLLFGRGFPVLPAAAQDATPTEGAGTGSSNNNSPQPTPIQSSSNSTPTVTPSEEEILAAKMAKLNADLLDVQKRLDSIAAATNTTAYTVISPTAVPASPTTSAGSALGSVSPTTGVVSPTICPESNNPATSNTSVNDPANVGTGPLSTNDSVEQYNKKMETLNKNLAEVQNKVDAINSTGFNSANFNSLNGQVFTGDALSSLNLLNKLNSNMTGLGSFSVFNVYDAYAGDIVFKLAGDSVTEAFDSASGTVTKNAVTGPGSGNNAVAENNFKVKEANGNDAKIQNDIDLEAVSGSNTASFNTGDGAIQTGNATAIGNVVNMANTNLNVVQWLIGVVNIWGKMIGNIILPQDSGNTASNASPPTVMTGNSATGPGSTNNASYTTNETASFTNVNDTVIQSVVNASANTGNNTASVNTGGGSVITGNSDVAVSDTTVANVNTNSEDDTVWMIIVNQAGKWVGQIVGTPWGATSASNSLPLSQTSAGAGQNTFTTQTTNSNTGPMSDNNASYSETSDTEVTNDNQAAISNNIIANADSGNNEASYNTGAGTIDTGDAKVGLNLVNMANTNVTAKKFIVVLVNIMDELLGNIIPPQQQVPPATYPSFYPNPTGNPLPTSTPSISPTPSITSSSNIGGAGEFVQPTPTPTVADQQKNTDYAYYYYYYPQQQSNTAEQYVYPTYYPQEYYQAVNQVAKARTKVTTLQNQFLQGAPIQQAKEQVRLYKRGVFLSPAFAKATETSFTGILLGGASWRVTQSWLSIIPLAILIIFLRRRRKINFGKYLDALLEIIL